MTAPHVFKLDGGRVTLDSTVAVEDVDFQLDAGEFLALLGANGSGKTTLVRALLGLVPLTAGRRFLFGDPPDSFTGWARIGYVPQRSAAVSAGAASVTEVVLSGRVARSRRARRYRSVDRAAAAEALEVVGLTEVAAAPVTRLSGGQQQRVLIARALAGSPEALVLDEPLAGVDVEHQERVAGALRDFNSGGGAVLLVAHGLGPVEDLVTREILMDSGRVVYNGPHHADHIHAEHVHHHDEAPPTSPLDRAAGAR